MNAYMTPQEIGALDVNMRPDNSTWPPPQKLVLAGGDKLVTADQWRRRVMARRRNAIITTFDGAASVLGFVVLDSVAVGSFFALSFVVGLAATFLIPSESGAWRWMGWMSRST